MNWKCLAWSGFKLCLGILAVASAFLLNQRLNSMGCRYAVNTVPVLGAGLMVSGEKVLKHRYSGYFLDLVYVLALFSVLVFSFQGITDLESGGCKHYFEGKGLEVTEFTVFMNETEYKNWLKEEDNTGKDFNKDYLQDNGR